jgi:hypothetical protein
MRQGAFCPQFCRKVFKMGMHPRWVRSDLVTSTTQRTIDRQFLFKPDPFIRNLIGASAARAFARFPVLIYWLEYNINHEQAGIAPIDDTPAAATNLVRFKQLFHRLVAQGVNGYLDREGAVFSSRSRDVHCVDNESVEDRYFYALLNPVKDGLCDRIRHWGGFSSYASVCEGRHETYTYIDLTAWHQAGGARAKIPKKAFEKTISLQFAVLPGWEKLTVSQRQTRIRRRVRELEQHYRAEREAAGRFAMTPERMAKINHRDRPKNRPAGTRKPLCHAASVAAAKRYKAEHQSFCLSHRLSSIHFLSGYYDVEFPRGSFRPPLIAAAA